MREVSKPEKQATTKVTEPAGIVAASGMPALESAELQARHRRYLQAATSDNTRRTYRSAIHRFERWGGRLPTDRDTLIRYLLAHAETLNTRTLDVHLTALSQWHRFQGFADPGQDPTVRKTLEGMRRVHGQPKRKARALRLEHLVALIDWLQTQPESLKKHRDLALVQTGFFGAFRRSELVSIQVEDLSWESEGLIIRLPRSKTDQQGEGLQRALPAGNGQICPVRALRNWLLVAEITSGPVFRPISRWNECQTRALRPAAVNELLKSLGTACGFDFVPELSSHSFRRGLSTSAARENLSFEAIKKQGGWKNDAVVRGYIDEGRQFADNVATTLINELNQLLEKDSKQYDSDVNDL
ncbi:MAG: integrase [unclassified Hahellaceae]|nr:integrase [Hahellaceae bacterium]|tara:strand:- start:19570 stop:20637 length:1068 start_codon:yes stop_codon:yes gene_type:complete